MKEIDSSLLEMSQSSGTQTLFSNPTCMKSANSFTLNETIRFLLSTKRFGKPLM